MRPPVRLVLPAALALAVFAAPGAHAQARAPAVPAACVDFHAHANHEWLRAHPASAAQPERSRLGELAERAARQQADLLATTGAPSDEAGALLATFWAAGNDEAGLDRASAAALQAALAPLAQLRRPRDLAKVGAAFHRLGLAPLAEFVRLEAVEGAERPLAAVPVPLGLVDPAFYTSADPDVRTLLGKYRSYVETVLRASGLPEAEISPASEAVLQIETQLAEALSAEAPDTRSSDTLRAQDRRFLAVGFAEVLDALDARAGQLVVVSPAYFATFSRIAAAERDTKRLQWYLRFRVLNRLAPELGAPLRSAHAGFYAQTLRGLPTAPTRAEHMDALLRRSLGGLNDRVFNARQAPAGRVAKAEAVAEAVRSAAVALVAKAGADASRIGAVRFDIAGSTTPSFDIDGLVFRPDDHVGNLLRLSRWQEARVLAGRSTAIDALPARRPAVQWQTNSDTFVVTAAALAPPLLAEGDGPASAADFGAFGALVGHELAKRLQPGDRGAGLGPLYNGFKPMPDLRVDGVRTLPMNRADLAGLEFAWAAFEASSPQADVAEKRAFFTAWASVWAKTQTIEALRSEVQASPYAPAAFRVNGPLSQMPAFAEAFGCRPGQPMRAANPIAVWR